MNPNTKRLLILNLLLLISFNIFSQSWTKSFTAGDDDVNGKFLGGSEVLQLINHKNELYASIGYWEDENNIWYGGTNPSIGWGQIIRLDTPNGQWQEDFFLGASYLRPELLKQIIFTKDASGSLLPNPDTVLIAAAYSPNFFTGTVTVTSFARNDDSGSWGESQIMQGGLPAGEDYSIRDIEVYTDQVTGIEKVYASVGTQGIYTGKYNPLIPGKIDWIPNPEFGPLNIRPLGITTANNTLYFSSGNQLYRRQDGVSLSYSVAHDFSDLSTTINSAVGGIRGLTTIPNPNGNDEALLLMWCPNGQSKGVIYRLEPDGAEGFNRFYETKISLLVESYLPGTSVTYLLGAYNEFYTYVEPFTNDTIHIVGFEADITGGGYPTWNGYYKGGVFTKRDADMQYTLEEINGPIGINDTALVANRCYVKSPFGNENAIYFGGFDPNSNTATNMAWIYKKEYLPSSIHEPIEDEIKLAVYPNPAINQLTIEVKTNDMISYEIMSVLGETMLSGYISSGNQTVDISELTPNIYFVRIDGQIFKFVKTK